MIKTFKTKMTEHSTHQRSDVKHILFKALFLLLKINKKNSTLKIGLFAKRTSDRKKRTNSTTSVHSIDSDHKYTHYYYY